MKKIKLPISDIKLREKYESGESTTQLATEFGVSSNTIAQRIKKLGVTMRKPGESNAITLPISDIELRKEYENGKNIQQLADEFNVLYKTIRSHIIRAGGVIRTAGESNTITFPISDLELLKAYNNGKRIYQLADEFQVSSSTIKKHIIIAGGNIILSGTYKKIILPISDFELLKEYENGKNTIQLSETFNVCNTTIIKHIKAAGGIINEQKEAQNILSPRICIICKRIFDGKPASLLCPDCNPNEYCYKFNEDCKEHNRNKYNRECFFCGKTEKENGVKLSVHHIDYNKNQGCDGKPDWKLIPLCKICHSMTGGKIENRKLWEARILYLHKEYHNKYVGD